MPQILCDSVWEPGGCRGSTGCDFLGLVFLTAQFPLWDPLSKNSSVLLSTERVDLRPAGRARAQKPKMSAEFLTFKGFVAGFDSNLLKKTFSPQRLEGGTTRGQECRMT